MDCLNCVETTARLHLYLDRELSAAEIEIVQQHLSDCPVCTCRFHFDMCVKRLVHERCTIEHAPPHLQEVILRLARTPVGTHVELDPEFVMEIRGDLEGSDEEKRA